MAERRRLIEEAKIRFGDPGGLVKAYSKSQSQQGRRGVDRLSVNLGSVKKTTASNRFGETRQYTVDKRGSIDKAGNITINRSVRGSDASRSSSSTRKATFSDIFGAANSNPSEGVIRGIGGGGNFLKNFEREVQSIDSILSGQSTPSVERKKTKGLPMLEGRRFFESLSNLNSLSRRTTL